MDSFTLVVTAVLAAAIMASSMGLLYLAGSRQACLLDWALSGLCFACSSILGAFAIKLQTSHFLIPGFANAFYIAGHFGILAGLRRHLGLAPGWKLLAVGAASVLALHALPLVHGSVINRLFLFTPIIVAINLGVALSCWRHAARGGLAPYLPLALLELFFMVQLSLRAVYLIASEHQALTFMGSQFLQTSGSLFVLVFLSVATMSCALIVSHQQAQALRRASLTDALTGWLNRRALHDIATREFRRCQQGGASLHCITFDIDHFKAINDGYGHAVGDAAICHVTALAAGVLRGCDNLFRIGGEEFAVLLGGVAPDAAFAIAERLREAVAAAPLQADGVTVPMSISVGLAELADGDQKWEDLLRRADEALYLAKQQGRNRVAVHGLDWLTKGVRQQASLA
jgi:diguanylate cyclase (GGDEF)-like protein